MDPFTAIAVAGSAVKAVGSVVGAQSDAKAMKGQARIADANAVVASQQASARQDQMLREGRGVLGAQAAAIAQSGTGFDGSNLDVAKQSATNLHMDALNVGYEGDLKRTSLTNEARGLRKAASARLTQGWVGAGADLLQGVGSYGANVGKTTSSPKAKL